MAGFNYARSRATAERLIARFGQDGAIRRVVNSGPDWDPVQTIEDFACKLVDLDYEEKNIDGTLIMRGDRMVYLSTAGLTLEPQLSDKVLIGGTEHAIQNVLPLSPGGFIVFWQLQARK